MAEAEPPGGPHLALPPAAPWDKMPDASGPVNDGDRLAATGVSR